MWKSAIALVLAGGLFARGPTVGGLEQKPGIKWIKEKDGISHRTVEAKGERFDGGNVSNYVLRLEDNEVFAYEVDDNRGFAVGTRPYGHLEVRKDDKGNVSSYTVKLG